MQIDLSLFPAFDSPYTNPKSQTLAASVMALHLQLIHASGNSLHSERTKGHYFFRNESVPLPRPATMEAWSLICRIGCSESPYFIPPFLPSLRADDEVGDAIQTRGAKVPSLSRKSSLHLRDDQKRIIWGSVYLARVDDYFGNGNTLLYEYDRSNITESKLSMPRGFFWPASQESPIRHRMEFLASFGLPASNGLFAEIQIPAIHRLLFQFFRQDAVEAWSGKYAETHHLVKLDSGLAKADHKELMREIIESKQGNKGQESDESDLGKALEKYSKKPGRFADLGDISF